MRNTRYQLVKAIQHGCYTEREISAALDITRQQVNVLLHELIEGGFIGYTGRLPKRYFALKLPKYQPEPMKVRQLETIRKPKQRYY